MAIEAPILIFVSDSPSVSDQPAGHLVRSTVQPSGPVSVLPSADLPQWLSLIRFTMAARSFVQSASHSSIDWGSATGAVVVLPPAVVAVAPLVVVAPPAVVAVLLSLLSSPPHAAATRARLMNPATTPTLRRLCTDIPSS